MDAIVWILIWLGLSLVIGEFAHRKGKSAAVWMVVAGLISPHLLMYPDVPAYIEPLPKPVGVFAKLLVPHGKSRCTTYAVQSVKRSRTRRRGN